MTFCQPTVAGPAHDRFEMWYRCFAPASEPSNFYWYLEKIRFIRIKWP